MVDKIEVDDAESAINVLLNKLDDINLDKLFFITLQNYYAQYLPDENGHVKVDPPFMLIDVDASREIFKNYHREQAPPHGRSLQLVYKETYFNNESAAFANAFANKHLYMNLIKMKDREKAEILKQLKQLRENHESLNKKYFAETTLPLFQAKTAEQKKSAGDFIKELEHESEELTKALSTKMSALLNIIQKSDPTFDGLAPKPEQEVIQDSVIHKKDLQANKENLKDIYYAYKELHETMKCLCVNYTQQMQQNETKSYRHSNEKLLTSFKQIAKNAVEITDEQLKSSSPIFYKKEKGFLATLRNKIQAFFSKINKPKNVELKKGLTR